jgi:hypothetical protein
MAITQIDGLRQIQNETIKRQLLKPDFLEGSNLDLTGGNQNATLSGLAAGSLANDAVNKGQMDAAISAAITGGMTYKGQLDASNVGTTLDGAVQGDFWYISVAGTLDGIAYSVGDHLVVNANITDFDVDGSGKIDIIDNTESTDILRDADIVNDLVTGGTDKVLSAQQGVVLKGFIDGLQTELDDTQAGAGLNADGSYTPDGTADYISTATSLKNADSLLDDQIKVNADAIAALQTDRSERVFGEEYAPGVNSTSYTVANFPIAAGTLRVYINGMRSRPGVGNDYTVVESTGVITFTDTLKANKDVVMMDYEY